MKSDNIRLEVSLDAAPLTRAFVRLYYYETLFGSTRLGYLDVPMFGEAKAPADVTIISRDQWLLLGGKE